MRKRILIGGAVAVISIGAAIFAVYYATKNKDNGVTAQIQISASGFSPSNLTVKAGTHIIWKNIDAAPHTVASNPYPSNSSLKDLHSQTILPNGTYTYTVAEAGTIQYHDGTLPTHNASIKVEK